MKHFQVAIECLNPAEAEQLVRQGEFAFDKPLSDSIDIHKMSEKWSRCAKFLIVRDRKMFAAMIVYYENLEGKFVYIPHFVVMPDFRHKGVGHFALDTLLQMTNAGYNEIRLEVKKENNTAKAFYTREDFVVMEERKESYLLTKHISPQ